jgi:hypothetical protein
MRRTFLLLAIMAVATAQGPGCAPRAKPVATPGATKPRVDLTAVGSQVEQFCGNCHAMPLPDSFPQDRWPHEVARGYEFYLTSGRADLAIPRRSDVIAYYQQLAPQRLSMPASSGTGPSRFERRDVSWPGATDDPAIAHIMAGKAADGVGGIELACCDMRSGLLTWFTTASGDLQIVRTWQLDNPDHIAATDLDADGRADFIVSDLGSFPPEDHARGRVVWLRPSDKSGRVFEEQILLDGVGRVADAQPADFDGDGDLDIVVAIFGWYTTGSVVLLRNQGQEEGRPRFVAETLDPRVGAIHVPVADLNGDGRQDFVALFAQEHESVEAFLAQPDGRFEKQILYRAPDPSYGSSGIQVVDLDGDGDLDVLYTNGDTFDSFYVKPYHGIRWIENRGPAGWQEQLLAHLPGVSRAVAGDLDGDGDLDIAACAVVPARAREHQPEITRLSSLVWLQQEQGKFSLHEIEADHAVHAALELADVNADGALDIVVGAFDEPTSAGSPLTVWFNRPQR